MRISCEPVRDPRALGDVIVQRGEPSAEGADIALGVAVGRELSDGVGEIVTEPLRERAWTLVRVEPRGNAGAISPRR
jgi:hypothetical protein